MSRRIVIGRRSNGDIGVFVAPPGYDAYTLSDSLLTMSIHSKMSSLLLMGYLNSSGTVTLGFGASPIVLLSGIRSPVIDVTGLTKPSPIFYHLGGYSGDLTSAYYSIVSGGAYMSVVTSFRIRYEVYNEVS